MKFNERDPNPSLFCFLYKNWPNQELSIHLITSYYRLPSILSIRFYEQQTLYSADFTGITFVCKPS